MTARRDALDAIAHRTPSRVPYDLQFTAEARRKMAEFYGDDRFEAKLGGCLTIARVGMRRNVGPDLWEDEFGVLWDRSRDRDIGIPANRLITPETLPAYRMPDPDESLLCAEVEAAVQQRHDTLVVVKFSYNLFERAWSLVGLDELLMAMVTDPPLVHTLLDRLTDYYLRLIERVTAYPVDAVLFGDDWGSQRGLLMGPAHWRAFLKPRVAELYRAVRRRGGLVFLHCCGKVQELLPELIECGLDVLNPFQPEVMDVAEMKRLHGDRLTFYGGISTQQTLPRGNVAQTRDEVRRLLDLFHEGGGCIAAPAHAIPGDARPENIAAMIDVLRTQ